jgi:anthranilate phosphoribosyltransferase
MTGAYLLINIRPGKESNLAADLLKLKEVKEANVVYGEYDLIVRIEVKGMNELQQLVMDIRKRPDVERTSTMITVQ